VHALAAASSITNISARVVVEVSIPVTQQWNPHLAQIPK
jgi:hypothetical protein